MYVVFVRCKTNGVVTSLAFHGDFDCYDKALEKAKLLVAAQAVEVEIVKAKSTVTRKIDVNIKEV